MTVIVAVKLGCPVLKENFSNCSKNAACTSKAIQNELVSIFPNKVVEKCSTEIKDSGMFFILADEPDDISNVEQISIVIRYEIYRYQQRQKH